MSQDQTLAGFYRFDVAKAASDAKALHVAVAHSNKLNAGLRSYAADQLVGAARGMLNSPLSDVLADGWKKWRDIAALADPNAPESQYALDNHEIAFTRKPKAEILLNGGSIGLDIEFQLKLALKLDSAILTIRGGRIVAAKLGAAQGSGTFSCGEVTLAERKSGKLDLPGDWAFDPGYVIAA